MSVIRPAQIDDAPAIARVHVDTWRTTYAGIVPDAHLANLSYERCQAGWVEHLSNQSGTFVVEVPSGQIVAFASGGSPHDALPGVDGELYNLYVLKAFQGNGYGRLLMAQVTQDLISKGCRAMLVWVLKDNPARHFYERLGGRMTAEKVVEIGGKQLMDVAYVWADLTSSF